MTTVILNRRDVPNAVKPTTGTKLVDAFLMSEQDEEAAVAVFLGKHGTICGTCGGGDLKALSGDDGEI